MSICRDLTDQVKEEGAKNPGLRNQASIPSAILSPSSPTVFSHSIPKRSALQFFVKSGTQPLSSYNGYVESKDPIASNRALSDVVHVRDI